MLLMLLLLLLTDLTWGIRVSSFIRVTEEAFAIVIALGSSFSYK